MGPIVVVVPLSILKNPEMIPPSPTSQTFSKNTLQSFEIAQLSNWLEGLPECLSVFG